MTSFVQHIDDDTNYKVLGIVKEVKKILKKDISLTKYSKSDCIADMVALAVSDDRDKIVNEIIQMRKKKGVQVGK